MLRGIEVEEKVSVVIPIYNAEKYLKKCIESVLKQSYTNLEVILVNDGSKDQSLAVCKMYEKQDARVVLIDKQNGGVSAARNDGIKIATGKYILFLDSDDFIPKDAVKKMHRAITKDRSDFVFGGYTEIGVKHNKIISHASKVVCLDKNGITTILQMEGINYICSKLYRLDNITKNRVLYDGRIKIGEDEIFVCKYLRTCSTVSLISDNLYYYNRLNEFSATGDYKDEIAFYSTQTLKEKIETLEFFGHELDSTAIQSEIEKRFCACLEYTYYFKNFINDGLNVEIERCLVQFAPYINKISTDNNLVQLGKDGRILDIMKYLQGSSIKGKSRNLKNYIISQIIKIKIEKIYK